MASGHLLDRARGHPVTRRRRAQTTTVGYSPSRAGPESLRAIAYLVHQANPAWDEGVTRVVLAAHAQQVNMLDLAIAALRAAATDGLPGPRAIGWRGPWWSYAPRDRLPLQLAAPQICRVCGKPEPRCYAERPGPDDHAFEAKP